MQAIFFFVCFCKKTIWYHFWHWMLHCLRNHFISFLAVDYIYMTTTQENEKEFAYWWNVQQDKGLPLSCVWILAASSKNGVLYTINFQRIPETPFINLTTTTTGTFKKKICTMILDLSNKTETNPWCWM